MRDNGSIHIRPVLTERAVGWWMLAGMAAMFVALCWLADVAACRMAAWDPSPVALPVAHALRMMRAGGHDGYIVGSSQINQVQPRMMRDITGCDIPSVCVPGGDIVFTLAMAQAATVHQTRPLVLAEFSRYIVSPIEEPVYRDTLRFVPARYWAAHEAGFALNQETWCRYYCEGVRDSLMPFVRYKEGIKAFLIHTFPACAAWLVDPAARPSVVRQNSIHEDGHCGPYPHRSPPYYGMPPLEAARTINAHKAALWKDLLALHQSGKIRLVLVMPPAHAGWKQYYEVLYHGTNSPAAALASDMVRAGVPVTDCTVPSMPEAYCMDTHHFTWDGCGKFSEMVACGITGIVGRAAGDKTVGSLSGCRLSDVLQQPR